MEDDDEESVEDEDEEGVEDEEDENGESMENEDEKVAGKGVSRGGRSFDFWPLIGRGKVR